MVAERITPAAVVAERDLLDGEERRIVGQLVIGLAFTNATVKDLAPREMEEVAAYLLALLDRAPIKTSPAFQPHRMVLGSLASELRGFAAAAGEPVGLQVDLRGSGSQADEQRIRARLADQAAAFERSIDDAIAAHVAQSLYQGAHEPEDVLQEPEDDPGEPSAQPAPQETVDAPAYVL
jgi:hypothetical protein